MTTREKLLATSLVGVLLVFGGGMLFHIFVYEPITEVRGRLETERTELAKKQEALEDQKKQIDGILKVNPRLNWWSQISLPSRDPDLKKENLSVEEQKRKHQANMRVAYEAYLSKLMGDAGFQRGTVKVTVRQANRGGGATVTKGKEPPYEQLTFGVVGEGTMENVSKVMTAFHKTPLLHHVRTVSLCLATEKETAGKLKMDLTVDALLMAAGEERKTLEPSTDKSKPVIAPRVLAEPSRDYLVMNKINMFTGYKPPTTPTVVERKDPVKVTENPNDVLRFVKVTSLIFDPDRKRWEATLYDQAKGGKEKVLNAGSRDEFTIVDKDDNPMLKGKVIQVAEDFLIIMADGKYHRLQCGETLFPAIRKSLSRSELRELGITPDESEKGGKKTEATEDDSKEEDSDE